MSEITRARDILREMRAAATPGEWSTRSWPGTGRAIITSEPKVFEDGYTTDVVTLDNDPADATLIVVLAGNPVLLDAIDGMLADAEYHVGRGTAGLYEYESLIEHAESIASAIVSGYEALA